MGGGGHPHSKTKQKIFYLHGTIETFAFALSYLQQILKKCMGAADSMAAYCSGFRPQNKTMTQKKLWIVS